MPGRYPLFETSRLKLLPLAQRRHEMDISDILPLSGEQAGEVPPEIREAGQAVIRSVRSGRQVVVLMGAHVIKQGLSRYLIDMIRRGWISVVAVNGACAIHDYELARIGASTESVARYLSEGQFGLWTETGELNRIVKEGEGEGLGFGQAVGRAIHLSDFPHKDVSIFAGAYARDVPVTVHVGIGYDIIHEHPTFDAAAAGAASYRDFLILAKALEALEGGTVLCFGSAVMGPEVFLKALAMARNVAHQGGRTIGRFSTAVFDLVRLAGDLHSEAPKDAPEYYFRPYKTLLVRAVADGGRSVYVQGDHRRTIPALYRVVRERLGD